MKTVLKGCGLDRAGISEAADELLEECVRGRLGLRATLKEFLPKAAGLFGADAAAAATLNDDLDRETFSWRAAPPFPLYPPPRAPFLRKAGGLYWAAQPLDVAGEKVGALALGYRKAPAAGPDYWACLNSLCEQLDGPLWGVHNAAVKQKLVEKLTRCLTRSVLREALDEAVAALHAEIPFRHLGLVYRNDDETDGGIQYRVYRGKRCVHDSELRPHRALDRAIARDGLHLLDPGRSAVRKLLGMKEGVGFALSGQAAGAANLGKLVAEADGGLSSFGRDLLRVFANSISQRLIDYNRERRHMAKFFPPDTVSELLRDPHYHRRYLSPRVRGIALLYADINSFTRICEKGLRSPERIGEFVDRWSEGAVRIAWNRGGVFDKMVGDCVIIHFGPPFFRHKPARLVREAALTAMEIQAFTARLGRLPRYRAVARAAGLPGLGVAIGINLCPAAVGMFGPNHDFTAFSSGMNQTARLQAKAGFRETLLMDSAREALVRGGEARGLSFKGPFEAEAKNVAQPLRYYRLGKS